MFELAHHQLIEKLLNCFDVEFLAEANCYFGGGTAIVLALGEYRESVDVDFLCACKLGYRALRNTVTQQSLGNLLIKPVKHLREVRCDLYGIRTFLEIDGTPIKVEFISEGRIELCGAGQAICGVPTLSTVDMFAEKLLANTDCGLDKSIFSRDMIDLAMMIKAWGTIPPIAWSKVRAAYGASVDRAFRNSATMLLDRNYLEHCLRRMRMDPDLLEGIQTAIWSQISA